MNARSKKHSITHWITHRNGRIYRYKGGDAAVADAVKLGEAATGSPSLYEFCIWNAQRNGNGVYMVRCCVLFFLLLNVYYKGLRSVNNVLRNLLYTKKYSMFVERKVGGACYKMGIHGYCKKSFLNTLIGLDGLTPNVNCEQDYAVYLTKRIEIKSFEILDCTNTKNSNFTESCY